MAKARKLEKRRESIRKIRQITRTMELVSTVRFRRALNRAAAAQAFTQRIQALVGNLTRAGLEHSHPLLEERAETNKAILLVLTANRGLCGGYNASVLRLAFARLRELRPQVPEVRLEVSGKRGISAMRFRKIETDATFTHFENKPTFEEVEVLANRYLGAYQAGTLDRLDVAYTKFETASRQQAVVETLLPLGGLEGPAENNHGEQAAAPLEYEFLPSAQSILDELVPASFKVRLLKCFLDAAVSEQIARMVAMKAATENADSMIRHLTMAYNRARQGQITSELLEVISGTDALSE